MNGTSPKCGPASAARPSRKTWKDAGELLLSEKTWVFFEAKAVQFYLYCYPPRVHRCWGESLCGKINGSWVTNGQQLTLPKWLRLQQAIFLFFSCSVVCVIDLSLVAMEASCLELITDVAIQRTKKEGRNDNGRDCLKWKPGMLIVGVTYLFQISKMKHLQVIFSQLANRRISVSYERSKRPKTSETWILVGSVMPALLALN